MDNQKELLELVQETFNEQEVLEIALYILSAQAVTEAAQQGIMGGYKEVRLYDAKTGTLRHMKVHTAVLTAFTGPRPDGYEVNHIDEDRSNNRLENLEWMTPIDNCRYSKALPVDMLDEDGNVIKTFPSIRATADDGFIPEDVRRAAYGTRETHGGYQWAFSSETSRRKPSRLTQSRRRYMR